MARRGRSSGRRRHGCRDHLVVAPLWVAYGANLGTLLRTCDAVGACTAVPRTPWPSGARGASRQHYREALARGNTLPGRACVHRVGTGWLDAQRARGSRVVAVELGEDATPLPRVGAAVDRTVVLLGHEHHGVPPEVCDEVDETIVIPMTGQGASLNVAVAGSLVLYRLAGLM